MSSALLALLLLAADPSPTAVVVAPREFVPALQPWIEHREAQGIRVLLLPNTGTTDEIRAAIRRIAASEPVKFVLLVGDAEPAARTDPSVRARSVPTRLQPAVVNVKWGSEPEIATDNGYADLDDDQSPDLAIGRLPADSPAELSRIVGKILAYERNTDFGPWRQRVNFIAGVGGFSPLIDGVIETATSRMLTSGIPAAYESQMTYGSWRSPYCPDPRLFHDTAVRRHNEGCLFWVYIGHGHAHGLDRVSVPGERFHIFDVDDCPELRAAGGPPIAVMLACYTAAFDQPRDCLAEELLRASGGPVAIFGGTRVTMPYAMGVMGSALMDEYFQKKPTTLGEAILAAKRRTMQPPSETEPLKDANRIILDGVASVISPSRESMEAERREHLALFNLIGDPLLRLTYPHEVALEAPREAGPGQKLTIYGTTPLAGTGVLELVCRRDCHKTPPPVRERFDPTDKGLAALHDTYTQSLDRCWGRWALDLPAGRFGTEIVIPDDCRGPCHVRLAIAGDKTHALGAANLYIRPQPPERAASLPKVP
ncbi:MAG: C25 family cysteine peptidase [Pirellulaceae bacterium]|nr:C25 family cysteine peptidase [Pirellulaceae bacterium]